MDNKLKKETEKVIEEIIYVWMGHKKQSESEVWNDFYWWCEDIARCRLYIEDGEVE
jgi:hypothetical protein